MQTHMQASEIEVNTPVKYCGKNWLIHGREDNGNIRLQTDYPHAEDYVRVPADYSLELGHHTFGKEEESAMAAHAERMEAIRFSSI